MTPFVQRVLREVRKDPGRSSSVYAARVYGSEIGARGRAGRISHVSQALYELARTEQVVCDLRYGGGETWRVKL